MQKKHKVQSTKELLAIQEQLETDLQAVLNIGEEIAALEKQVAAEAQEVKKLATDFSQLDVVTVIKNIHQNELDVLNQIIPTQEGGAND